MIFFWTNICRFFNIHICRDPGSPSENGNGTEIPFWGGDYAPQSSSDKVIGSLGYIILYHPRLECITDPWILKEETQQAFSELTAALFTVVEKVFG